MDRKKFIQQTSLASAGLFFSKYAFSGTGNTDFPIVRVPEAQRKFKSKSVEALINQVQKKIGNPEIAWMFGNCFPNTLDTTVDFEMINGKPDTYVITGDIDAMWLRDSTAQVWPYIPLCREDKELQQLIKGVINRQVKCILKDPYANAFYKDENKISEWKSDLTDMKPGIHERKWEVDSLCYPIRLSYAYWKTTQDTSVFDAQWVAAMELVIKTFKEQQRFDNKGPYHFQRTTAWATDGVPLSGYGYPVKPNGLICSVFRPSDDATIYPYLVPSNFFAVIELKHLAAIAQTIVPQNKLSVSATALSTQVENALRENAIIDVKGFGKIYAYEVNGFGSFNLMDDSNVPSLLALPYMHAAFAKDTVYINTRKYILSDSNPFYYKVARTEGGGSPHTGADMIWPLSIILRGLTSDNDIEIKKCISLLQQTHAGTGFMHESFQKDHYEDFTRKWFAWANTIFGEFIWKVYQTKPYLLN